jgi:hypothetical protein
VPGGSLLITSGGDVGVREVVRIDTRREFAVSGHHPMLTPRRLHAAVYQLHISTSLEEVMTDT